MICKVRPDAIIHAEAYTAVVLAEPKNDSNRVDETCIKIKGQWNYLYRAVDSNFNTIDFMQAANRDIDTAKRFFKKALSSPLNQSPRVITVDNNTAYPLSIQQLMNEKALPKEMHMIRKGQAEYKSTVLSTVELINRLFGLVA
jgi:transposase-like protein